MIINAFNSGADSYMTDFEDSNSPNWDNQIQGQVNLYKAIRRELSFKNEAGKEYKLNDKIATLQIRPRGWHLDEKHVLVDGQRVSGGIFDFGLVFFHNAKEQIARGAGPSSTCRRWKATWKPACGTTSSMAQDHIGLPQGTIKATVLVETILATFEMEEILYELRNTPPASTPGAGTTSSPASRSSRRTRTSAWPSAAPSRWKCPSCAYALALVQACHKRGAPAMGGMSALIPIKNDPEANEKALAGIRHDKTRDANDGFDGGWVAHPGLVAIAMEEFVKVLGDKPNQFEAGRRQVRPGAVAGLPPDHPDHRSRPAQQHQRRHPLPRLLAGRQRLRAHPQPDGRRRHRRNLPLQVWQWVVSRRASSTTAARSPSRWSAR
jgi:malate synthase